MATQVAMQIFVKTLSGKTVVLDVDPNDTIQNIKIMIQQKEGIFAAVQTLLFRGKELKHNNNTISDYKIQPQAILHLLINRKHVNMQYPANYKSKPPSTIFIKTLTGKTITVNIDSNDTIQNVKAMIQKKEGIDIAAQIITFLGNQLRDDNKTISDYNIQPQATLYLLVKIKNVSYNLKPPKRIFIQKLTGYPRIDNGRIYLFVIPQAPKSKPYIYNITINELPSTTITDNIRINNDTNNRTITLDVEPNDTIQNIKANIQDKEAIPPTQQTIYFAGRKLFDQQTLQNCCVGNEYTLHLILSETMEIECDISDILSLLSTESEKLKNPIRCSRMTTINSIIIEKLKILQYSHIIKCYGDLPHVKDNNKPISVKEYNSSIVSIDIFCRLYFKLDLEKTIKFIQNKLNDMQYAMDKPLRLIKAIQNDELFEVIKNCKTFKQFGICYDSKLNLEQIEMHKIDEMVNKVKRMHEYDICILNRCIVAAKKKCSQYAAVIRGDDDIKEEIDYGSKYGDLLISFEKDIYKLDVRVADDIKTWNEIRLKTLKLLNEECTKKEDELLQIYELWSLDDFISYLNYCNKEKIEFDDETIEKFKLVDINGSRLSEINDSFLILAGINDPSKRKLIIKITNDLLCKYGGIQSIQMCCICTLNEVNTVCVPCGHMVYCEVCGKRSFQHTNKCPICRTNVITLVTTFKAGM